jgi:ribosome biogenesis protein Nip4
MSKSTKFRETNEIENEIIIQSLSKISPKISQFLIKTKMILFISFKKSHLKNHYPIVYLAPKNLRKGVDLIEDKGNIYSIGINFGFIKKGTFYLSLEGAEFLYQKEVLTEIKYLFVNKKGEKSILYGNNISNKMVIKASPNIKKDDFLLIFNEVNEIIAIGYSIIENYTLKQIKSKNLIAINLSDKGIYLREKQ